MAESESEAVLAVGVDPSRAQSGGAAAVRVLDEIRRSARETDEATKRTTRGFEGMGKATEDLSRALNNMRSMMHALGLGFSAWKIGDVMRDMTGLSARLETLDVVLGIVGRNSGYSRDQMTGFAESVKAMGITALGSRETIIRLTQAEIDLTQAAKLARVAQDAAVIGNLNSSEALERLVHGIQAAQTDVLRTIGINVQWDQSYQRFGQTLGKSALQLSEQEKTQARLNAVIEAGIPIQGAYEAAMGTANKTLGSTQRYVEDLKVSLGDLFLPSYKMAVFAYADALRDASKAFEQYKQSADFQPTQEKIARTMENIALALAGIADAAAPAFRLLGGAFGGVIDIFNSLPDWAREVGIVGAVLFGRKFTLALLAAGALNDHLKELAKHMEKIAPLTKMVTGQEPVFDIPGPRLEAPSLTGALGMQTTYQDAVGDFIKRARERMAQAPKLPAAADPNRIRPRTDVDFVQLDRANALLLEQARIKRDLADATLQGEDAVRAADLAGKERLYILEKLNGSTAQAERQPADYQKALRATAEAEDLLTLKQFTRSQIVLREDAGRLAAAHRGGAGDLLRDAMIENAAREQARRVGTSDFPPFASEIRLTRAAEETAEHEKRMNQMRLEVEALNQARSLRWRDGPERAAELAYWERRNELIASGTSLTLDQVDQQSRLAAEVARTRTAYEEWGRTVESVAGAMGKGLEDAILGAKSLQGSLASVALEIERIILRKTLIQPFERGIGNVIDKAFGFEQGGIMTAQGPVPLRKYDGGGIARGPQLAMYGEGSVPEAYVPVPSGRIPVELRGAAGGPTVNINVSAPVNMGGSGSQGISPEDSRRVGGQIAASIESIVVKVLREQRRPGNMLNDFSEV